MPYFMPSGFSFNDFDMVATDEALFSYYIKKVPFPEGDRGSKHPNRFGIAKSTDGLTWLEVGEAILPVSGTWEESMWAGGISTRPGQYVLYYTAVRAAKRQASCQIGKAYSKDLIHWVKDPKNPVFILDAARNAYYSDEPQLSFRDPFPFEHKGRNYVIFCGKDKRQPPGRQGCIGIAEESAAGGFRFMSPLFSPGIYPDGLECPALYLLDGRWYIFYGVDRENGETAFRYAIAASPFGPFHTFSDNQLLSTNNYACRIVHFKGTRLLYHWFRDYPDGVVRERLAPPKEVHILANGEISLSDWQ